MDSTTAEEHKSRLRARSADKVRADALKMSVRKAERGCFSCAEQYLEVARQNGATEEEIQQTKTAIMQLSEQKSGRRKLLKYAAAGTAVVTAGGLAFGSLKVFSSQAQITARWGTDSGTQVCCQMPQHFYVGRMGYGGEPLGDAYFFNIQAAKAAGHDRTYGYWGVVGPDYRPAGVSPLAWGQQQANHAWNAWNHGPNAQYIGGLTVFGDVEAGFGGWTPGNLLMNQAVLNGYLSQLFTITPHYVWPGLYISPYDWRRYFGQNYHPSTDYVLWLCGSDTCGSDLCSPCSPCSTLTTVQRRLNASVSNVSLGGRRPVMWQYWISDCGCGDYNVMSQNATSLRPANGGSNYSA